jgi:hypothetical protein
MVARMLGSAPTIADTIIEQLAAPFDKASTAKVPGLQNLKSYKSLIRTARRLLNDIAPALLPLGLGPHACGLLKLVDSVISEWNLL